MLPTFKLNIERWKYNPYFELWVSNMGHIRNRDKKDIAPKVKNNGYLAVKVYGSLNRYMSLHRVVMLTWKPTPEAEKLTVDHLDHNKRNNALSNLEWVTRTENESRARRDFLAEDKKKKEVVKEKKKKVIKTILGITVYSNNKQHKLEPVFIPLNESEKVHEVLAPFYGRVSSLTKKSVDKIVKNLLDGTNDSGSKKYCGFEFQAKWEVTIEKTTKI
jgi:hypothetical protein